MMDFIGSLKEMGKESSKEKHLLHRLYFYAESMKEGKKEVDECIRSIKGWMGVWMDESEAVRDAAPSAAAEAALAGEEVEPAIGILVSLGLHLLPHPMPLHVP